MKQGKRKELQKYRRGERMEKLEQNKGSLLAKLKPPFQVVNNLFNHRNTRYRGQAKNTVQVLSLFDPANLMLTWRKLLALNARRSSWCRKTATEP